MTKKYGRWNNAANYPNCNKLEGKLKEYSTEKMLYGDSTEIEVRNNFSNGSLKVGVFDLNILIRVSASHGLTRGQLENYLILQGMEINASALDNRLYYLVKYGYLSYIRCLRLRDDAEVILYDIAENGIALLRQNELPYQNPAEEYFASGDLFRFMRTKIVSNQIVLHLLCNQENLHSFYFQREFMPADAAVDNPLIMPLYIQTGERNYVFEFVGNTKKGKHIFQNRMEQLLNMQEQFPDNTVLVIVAETNIHMETLTKELVVYEKRDLKMEILYSHDSEWFYDIPGHYYAMTRAMGQQGLISVKLL